MKIAGVNLPRDKWLTLGAAAAVVAAVATVVYGKKSASAPAPVYAGAYDASTGYGHVGSGTALGGPDPSFWYMNTATSPSVAAPSNTAPFVAPASYLQPYDPALIKTTTGDYIGGALPAGAKPLLAVNVKDIPKAYGGASTARPSVPASAELQGYYNPFLGGLDTEKLAGNIPIYGPGAKGLPY